MIGAGTVYAELDLHTGKYDAAMQQAESKMGRFGQGMEKAGKAMTTRVTLPLVGLGAAITKIAMDFDESMAEVRAISGATGDQFAKLEEKAKEMGRTTRFSASESAQALKYMAMAGWETEEMLDGIEGVMALAAASGEDLAMVSDIVTDALTAFGMKAGQAGEFADLLAKASSSSNTNVAMMGETFKYVAPLAGALGYTAEDTALAIGLMANAGIKGSMAGTTLRGAITRLAKPTGDAEMLIHELGLRVTDAHGNMLPFIEIMKQMRERFADLTEEQQAQAASTIFGQQAMSGMLAIVNASEEDFDKLTDATRNYNGAAKDMADIMEGTTKGQLRELLSKLEGLALQFAKSIIPVVEKAIGKLAKLVDWFSALDEGTKETIVKMAALAAAISPVLLIGGKLAGAVTAITGLFGGVAGAAGAATGAVGAAGGGIGALGIAAKAGALLLNPWVLGIAAVTAGGVALYKHLQKDVIPEVDLFADKTEVVATGLERAGASYETVVTTISEGTKKAVGAYMELDEEAQKSLNSLYFSSTEITEELRDDMVKMYADMHEQIITGIKQKKEEELELLSEAFEDTKVLTEEEQEKILEGTEKHWQKRQETVDYYEQRITEIWEEAAEKNRKITDAEYKEIDRLKRLMKEDAIKVLSEQEVEAQIILERMKGHDERITAETMSEHIKQLNEGRDEAVRIAEDEYEKKVAQYIRMRDEMKTITAEQAEDLIAEAGRTRKKVIDEAEDLRLGALKKMGDMNGEMENQVDTTTGNILSLWDKVKRWWSGWQPETKTLTAREQFYESHAIGGLASGTNFHPGGLAWVGEQGPELVSLPRGTKVYPHEESMQMAGGVTQNVTINSPAPLSPSDIARKNLQVSRQLAMEWGL